MKNVRISIVSLCLCFVGAAAIRALAQASGPPVQGPAAQVPRQVQVAVTPHHVKGTIEKGDCTLPLKNPVMRVTEYWFCEDTGMLNSTGAVRSASPPDLLTFSGNPLPVYAGFLPP